MIGFTEATHVLRKFLCLWNRRQQCDSERNLNRRSCWFLCCEQLVENQALLPFIRQMRGLLQTLQKVF